MKPILLLSVLLALSAPAALAQIELVQIGSVDLTSTSVSTNPQYIGAHPSAVAWNGTDVYVAGFNDTAGVDSVGIVKVSTPLTTPSFSSAFGVAAATPAARGYSGLDIQGSALAAALDKGLTDPQGLQVFDLAGAPQWSANIVGRCGVGFDPGFASVDSGVGWTTFGGTRRSLNATVGGAVIYDGTTGMVILPSGTGFWRDMDFDEDTGDLYARRSNDITKSVRTGGNACTNSTILDLPAADFVAGQNVAYLNTDFGDYLIYNDRTSSAAGQTFASVVKVVDPAGAPATLALGAFSPPTSAGWYDFSWHSPTDTLAVLDFSNFRVTLFRVCGPPTVTPVCFGDGTGAACPCLNSGAAGNGCANSVNAAGAHLGTVGVASLSADTLVLQGSGMPNGPVLYFQGVSLLSPPTLFGDGLRCVGGTVVRLDIEQNAGGASQYPGLGDPLISVNGQVPPCSVRYYQTWYRDATPGFCSPDGWNLSNAVRVYWGL
jgi:hypothetical protein